VCLIIVQHRVDPAMPLVVAANRDEKLDRPAVAVTVLRPSGPRILGGRDLLAGGTWMAVNEHGLVAGLTNRPSAAGRDPSKRSRGELPLALAEHSRADGAVEDFVERFRSDEFNLAWLLVGDRRALFYLAMNEGGGIDVEALEPGLYVLGNGPLHERSPKTDLVRDRLAGGAPTPPNGHQWLRAVLADHTIPAAIVDEPPAERPPEIYAACVHTHDYGTRSSNLVTVPAEGRPSMRVADGPPCTTPFVSVDDLWCDPAQSPRPGRP
jgi:uncharacterized protein with NRDE domain